MRASLKIRNTFKRVYSAPCCENELDAFSISSLIPTFHSSLNTREMATQTTGNQIVLSMPSGSTWGAARLFSQTADKWMAGSCRMVPWNGGKGETQPFNSNRTGKAAEEYCSPWATAVGWVAAGGRCHNWFLSASLLKDDSAWAHYCH